MSPLPQGRPTSPAAKCAGLLVLGLVAGSCGAATPSAPRPDALTIAPAVEALKIGSTETLTAVLASGDGAQRTVTASWSSDAPEVVAVGDDARVRAVSLGKATVRASFQALSAVQPIRVVPDYQGTWSGEYRIVACNRFDGAGPEYCRFLIGAAFPLRFVVTQSGASVSGTFEFYTNTHRLLETGPVQGSIDDTGALVLMGATSAVDQSEPRETTLSGWRATLADDTGHMAGRFIKNLRFQNAWGLQQGTEDCEIVMLSRSP